MGIVVAIIGYHLNSIGSQLYDTVPSVSTKEFIKYLGRIVVDHEKLEVMINLMGGSIKKIGIQIQYAGNLLLLIGIAYFSLTLCFLFSDRYAANNKGVSVN